MGSSVFIHFTRGALIHRHNLNRVLQSPDWLHPAGFDAFGRELLPLLLSSSLASMSFSLAIVVLAGSVAIFLGGILALAPKRVQQTSIALLEGFLAFPSLIIALAWAAIRAPGWSTLGVALLLGAAPGYVRLLFLRASEVIKEDFIEASIAVGANRWQLLTGHLAPDLFRLSAVKFPTIFAQTLMAEATLSFLGIGAPIGSDTWGSLLAQGKDYLIEAPHLAFFTGTPLFLTVLALQGISERWELIGHRDLS